MNELHEQIRLVRADLQEVRADVKILVADHNQRLGAEKERRRVQAILAALWGMVGSVLLAGLNHFLRTKQ